MLTCMRLFGDGSHGTGERIQTFRCQACRSTFSARRNTPLYRLKTPASRVGEVLTALCEGLGQVMKVSRRRRLVRVTRRMRCGTAEDLRTALIQLGLSGRLNTAFIERVNLTLR